MGQDARGPGTPPETSRDLTPVDVVDEDVPPVARNGLGRDEWREHTGALTALDFTTPPSPTPVYHGGRTTLVRSLSLRPEDGGRPSTPVTTRVTLVLHHGTGVSVPRTLGLRTSRDL